MTLDPNAELETTNTYIRAATYYEQILPEDGIQEFILLELGRTSESSVTYMALSPSACTHQGRDAENGRQYRGLWRWLKTLFSKIAKRFWTTVTPGQFHVGPGGQNGFLEEHFGKENLRPLSRFEFCDHTSFNLESLICLVSVVGSPRFILTRITQSSGFFLHGMWYAMGKFPHSSSQLPEKELDFEKSSLSDSDEVEYHSVPAVHPATVTKIMERFGKELSKLRAEFRRIRVGEE